MAIILDVTKLSELKDDSSTILDNQIYSPAFDSDLDSGFGGTNYTSNTGIDAVSDSALRLRFGVAGDATIERAGIRYGLTTAPLDLTGKFLFVHFEFERRAGILSDTVANMGYGLSLYSDANLTNKATITTNLKQFSLGGNDATSAVTTYNLGAFVVKPDQAGIESAFLHPNQTAGTFDITSVVALDLSGTYDGEGSGGAQKNIYWSQLGYFTKAIITGTSQLNDLFTSVEAQKTYLVLKEKAGSYVSFMPVQVGDGVDTANNTITGVLVFPEAAKDNTVLNRNAVVLDNTYSLKFVLTALQQIIWQADVISPSPWEFWSGNNGFCILKSTLNNVGICTLNSNFSSVGGVIKMNNSFTAISNGANVSDLRVEGDLQINSATNFTNISKLEVTGKLILNFVPSGVISFDASCNINEIETISGEAYQINNLGTITTVTETSGTITLGLITDVTINSLTGVENVTIYDNTGTPVFSQNNATSPLNYSTPFGSTGEWTIYINDFITAVNIIKFQADGGTKTFDAALKVENITFGEQTLRYNDKIIIDQVNGVDSDVFPAGTLESPCKTFDNVIALSNTYNIQTAFCESNVLLDRDFYGWKFLGRYRGFGMNGFKFEACSFEKLAIYGLSSITADTSQYRNIYTDCIFDAPAYVAGLLENCRYGNWIIKIMGATASIDGTSVASGVGARPTFDVQGFEFQNRRYSGGSLYKNIGAGAVSIDGTGFSAEFDNTNVITDCVVRGVYDYIDNSTGNPIDFRHRVANEVWNAAYADYTTTGTFGKLLDVVRKSNLAIDGTVTANATTTSFDTDLNEPTGTHDHQVLLFTTGALIGFSRPILSFTNGVNNTIVLQEALPSVPSVNDEFVILPQHVHPIEDIQDGLARKTDLTPLL